MKITFLIGNGFDLAQGIDTSFMSFCKWYCQRDKEDTEIIKKFKKDISNDYKFWSDFEIAIGKYSDSYNVDSVNDYLDCIDDASEALNQYLIEVTDKLMYPDFKGETRTKILSKLLNFYDGLNPQEITEIKKIVDPNAVGIQFASFNYTNVLDTIVSNYYSGNIGTWGYKGQSYTMSVCKGVLHVHGRNDLYPIIGVDNESQISNKPLLKTDSLLTTTLIKKNAINGAGYDWDNQLIRHISESGIICVYGMSLGATDYRWWERLIDWLNANGTRHLIIYHYCDNPPKRIVLRQRLQEIERVKNTLKKYDKRSVWDKVQNRVHVIFNSEIFDFGLKTKDK